MAHDLLEQQVGGGREAHRRAGVPVARPSRRRPPPGRERCPPRARRCDPTADSATRCFPSDRDGVGNRPARTRRDVAARCQPRRRMRPGTSCVTPSEQNPRSGRAFLSIWIRRLCDGRAHSGSPCDVRRGRAPVTSPSSRWPRIDEGVAGSRRTCPRPDEERCRQPYTLARRDRRRRFGRTRPRLPRPHQAARPRAAARDHRAGHDPRRRAASRTSGSLARDASSAARMSAGSAGAFNCYLDRDIDAHHAAHARIARSSPASSPPARRSSSPGRSASASTVWLWLTTNWLAAALSLAAIFFYVVIYTLILKRRTEQNIVWGGDRGLLPGAHRLGGRHRVASAGRRSSCSPSSSCGRRRTTGRCR